MFGRLAGRRDRPRRLDVGLRTGHGLGTVDTADQHPDDRSRTTDPATTDPDTTGPGTGPQGFTSAKLSFFGDCPALLEYMQTEASERVTAWGFGGGGYYPMDGDVMMEATSDAAGAPTAERRP